MVVADDPNCTHYLLVEDGLHHAPVEAPAIAFDFEGLGPGDRDCTILEAENGDFLGILLNPLGKDDFLYGVRTASQDASAWDVAAHPDDAECQPLHEEWLNYFAADYRARRSVVGRFANRLSRVAGTPSRRDQVLERLEALDPARLCAGWELIELEQWARSAPVLVDEVVPTDEIRAASDRLRERAESFRCVVARQMAYATLYSSGLLLDAELAMLVDDARMAWDSTTDDWSRHSLARRFTWILPEEVPLLIGRQTDELLAARREGYSSLSPDRKAFIDMLLGFHGGCLVGGLRPQGNREVR